MAILGGWLQALESSVVCAVGEVEYVAPLTVFPIDANTWLSLGFLVNFSLLLEINCSVAEYMLCGLVNKQFGGLGLFFGGRSSLPESPHCVTLNAHCKLKIHFIF